MMNIPYKKRLLIVCIILGIIITLRFVGIGEYINLQQIKHHKEYLQYIVEYNYNFAVFAYIILYSVAVTLALPVAAVLTVAGGFFFGTLLGALYSNIGATIGATLLFLMVRYLIGNMLQKKYSPQLKRFNDAMQENGIYYLLTVHLIAVIPFFLINILAGLTNISLWTFVWTTSVGIFPGSLVFAFAGTQFAEIESIRDVFSFNIILAFILLALLALLPVIIKRIRKVKKVSNEDFV